jgi:hypothetical protein
MPEDSAIVKISLNWSIYAAFEPWRSDILLLVYRSPPSERRRSFVQTRGSARTAITRLAFAV